MLELSGIRKSFHGSHVLMGVDLVVNTGDVVALIGPSGSGKTTLLRCINYLGHPDAGTVRIDGFSVAAGQAKRRQITELRRQTAMVFQNYNLFKNKTVLENVTEGLTVVKRMSKASARERAVTELERVGMTGKLDSFPRQLSGGQQQRVGIARSLALDPAVLLLDEPTASLDPERSAEVLGIIRCVAETGITMIVATHEMGFARSVSTNVVLMEDGRIAAQGPPHQIFDHTNDERIARFVRASSDPQTISDDG
jgi:L-cystine transport system ATP-binding protein